MSLSVEAITQTAKAAFEASQLVSATERTRALHEIRKELEANKDSILRANGEDMVVLLGPSIIATPRLIKSLYSPLKDGENRTGRVAGLELGAEWMGE